MPPRKSNISAISTTNEDGTPTKETKDGVNIEVNTLSLLNPGPLSQLVPNAPQANSRGFPLRPLQPLPPRTDNTYIHYANGPSGLVPYGVYVDTAPIQLNHSSPNASLLNDPPAMLEYAAAPFPAIANSYHSQGSQGLFPLTSSGQIPPNSTLLPIAPAPSSLPSIMPVYDRFPGQVTYKLNADQWMFDHLQDLSLPRTMVQRLAKGVVPANTQITKDAILAIQKGATVFVNYLAQAANATAQTNNRRTIPPPAVFDGLHEIEFGFMDRRVAKELNKFNETNAGKRNEYRRKLKEEEKAKRESGVSGAEGTQGEDDEERAAKRARMGEAGEDGEAEGGVGMNGHADRDESAMNGHDGGDEDDPIDVNEGDEGDGNEGEGEGEGEGQEEPDEEEEEEEEEEDDEDEFPDEGRRLSSVEAETYTDAEARTRPESVDEAMSDEGSE